MSVSSALVGRKRCDRYWRDGLVPRVGVLTVIRGSDHILLYDRAIVFSTITEEPLEYSLVIDIFDLCSDRRVVLDLEPETVQIKFQGVSKLRVCGHVGIGFGLGGTVVELGMIRKQDLSRVSVLYLFGIDTLLLTLTTTFVAGRVLRLFLLHF